MRKFHSLKTMECDTDSFLHTAIVTSQDLCPPNLDTLIVRRHFNVAENFFDYLPDVGIYTALPSLNTLELKQSAAAMNKLSTSDYICQADRLRSRHAYAYKLFKNSNPVNLKVSIELGRGSSLIPPYLHGEPVPEVRCLYDASHIGFRRHINTEPVVDEASSYAQTHQLTLFHPFRRRSVPKSCSTHNDADAPLTASTSEDLPETDQLNDTDIGALSNQTFRLLAHMKKRFTHGWRLDRVPLDQDVDLDLDMDAFSGEDDDDDFSGTDEDGTSSDFEALIADLQNDGDEEAFLQFLEHMQEQGIEIDMESGDSEGGDSEGEDGEWHDAEDEIAGVDTDWEDAEDELEEHEADLD